MSKKFKEGQDGKNQEAEGKKSFNKKMSTQSGIDKSMEESGSTGSFEGIKGVSGSPPILPSLKSILNK